jgi:integrase
MSRQEVDTFLTVKQQSSSPRTADSYRRVLGEVERLLGAPSAWTIFGVTGWLNECAARGCSEATRHTYLQIVRSFSHSQLPDLWAQLPKRIPHLATAPRVAQVDEVGALYASPQVRPALKLALLLMADAGLRECEVRALRWEDVDAVNEVLRVSGKGLKARAVAIPSERLWAMLLKRKQLTGYVLPGQRGGMLTRGLLSRELGNVSETLLGHRLPGHSFRHGFAVRASNSGVGVNSIQRALGHATLAQTSHYLEGLAGDVVEMRKQFEAFR